MVSVERSKQAVVVGWVPCRPVSGYHSCVSRLGGTQAEDRWPDIMPEVSLAVATPSRLPYIGRYDRASQCYTRRKQKLNMN